MRSTRVLTIAGTRPEIIRLSQIIKKLDRHLVHRFIYTGQNWDACLKDIFFKDLDLRQPNAELKMNTHRFGSQIGQIFNFVEEQIEEFNPDKVLILGDTNSALSAIIAKRYGIPIYHMEAGNRCYDDSVPEEVNRRIIDHTSDVLLPYTHNSKENLIAEGIHPNKIKVIGNPIFEVIYSVSEPEKPMEVPKDYFLATIHRAENTNDMGKFRDILKMLSRVATTYKVPVYLSVHPRIRDKYVQLDGIVPFEPCSFSQFIHLQKHAKCVYTDSGTVQEECCIFNVPNVTIRTTTERPETIECGSNILAYTEEQVLAATEVQLENRGWTVPTEYMQMGVSDIVVKILCGV